MTQIALPLEPGPGCTATPDAVERLDPVGFRIGWDHARHGLTPPLEELHPVHPVRQGWEAGRAAGVRPAGRVGQGAGAPEAVRLWLRLRLWAWRRGRDVDEASVTPREIAALHTGRCPVTGLSLNPASPGSLPQPDDAVVLPLRRDSPVGAGTLVIVSRGVAQAAEGVDAARADALADTLAAQPPDALHDGLDAGQWRRLAALLAMCTPQPHAWLATRPLTLLPPPRLELLNAAQVLQVALTRRFAWVASGMTGSWTAPAVEGDAGARQTARSMGLGGLQGLGIHLSDASARRCYFQFLSALLARRLSGGPVDAGGAVDSAALEAAWLHPLLRARWQALVLALGESGCARLARTVRRLAPGAGNLGSAPSARLPRPTSTFLKRAAAAVPRLVVPGPRARPVGADGSRPEGGRRGASSPAQGGQPFRPSGPEGGAVLATPVSA